MNRISSHILTILILTILTSCIAFKKNNIHKKDLINLTVSSKEKIKIYAHWNFDFSPVQYSSLTYKGREEIFSQILEDLNCCELVKKKKDADLIIEGKAYNKRNPARLIGWFISAITFYIIPSWHESGIFVNAKVKNNKETKNYEVTGDSVITALWLPFFPVSPLFIDSLNKVEKQTMENSYKSLFFKMKRDGLL
jgi:hypothetical protein